MNNRFAVAAVAFLPLLISFNVADAAGPAAGPYDGEWKGTATSTGGANCRKAAVDITVEGKVVLGQAKFDGDSSNINGAVDERGSVGATIGFQFFKGRFSGDEFEGTFKFGNCDWEAQLHRTNAGERSPAMTSGLKNPY